MTEQQDPGKLSTNAQKLEAELALAAQQGRHAPPIRDRYKHRGQYARLAVKFLLPVIVIALAAAAMNFLVSSKPEVDRRAAREKAYAVETKVIKPVTFNPELVLYGTVSASRKVDLRALVGGEVIWVNPDLIEGRLVEKGTDLVRIDPFDYQGAVREAEANLLEAQAKLTETTASITSDESALERLIEQREFAQSDLERAEKLVKSGSLTRQALENRKLVLSQREQSVEARQNNLTVLKARIEQQNANIERLNWRLEQARRNLADTTLKAPFTGLVQTRNVDLGRLVSGNDTLVSLYDPTRMDVKFTLSDAQYGRLIADGYQMIGKEIEVRWKLGKATRSHVATIERVTPEVNAAVGGIEVFARLQPTSELRSGTFVELIVPDRPYENVIRIPQAAVYGSNKVYLNVNGRMQSVTAGVQAYLGETVLLDATSLPEGGKIITTRVAEAGDGLKLTDGTNRPQGKGNAKGGKGRNGSQSAKQAQQSESKQAEAGK